MRGSRWTTLALLALTPITVAGCHDAAKEAEERAALELSAIKADAGKSCQCEQRQGPRAEKTCWAHFNATMVRKHASFSFTTCAPVYQQGQCWTEDGAEQCLTTRYQAFLFHGGEALLCSAEQAKAAEAAWYRGAQESPDGITAADTVHPKRDAADAEIRRLGRGEPVVASRNNNIPSCI